MITARAIEDFFSDHKEGLGRVVELALKIREKIHAIDPFIQQHTSSVCPVCRKRCCIGRHAYYECDDLIYLYALGLKPQALERGEEEPCQFLSPSGCILDRTVRPSGCNWYFCGPLCDSMEKSSPGGAYLAFDVSLQELADLWIELAAEFRSKFRTIRGYELEQGGTDECL
jgi:hypothetical protein